MFLGIADVNFLKEVSGPGYKTCQKKKKKRVVTVSLRNEQLARS